MMNIHFMRITSRLLIVTTFALGMPIHSAQARVVGTDVAAAPSQFHSDRERIHSLFDREDVRKELQARGVDANAARARVDALTDEEVQRIAGQLDKLPAGGDIIGALLFVFILLLVTDILGLTKVYSFTRPIR